MPSNFHRVAIVNRGEPAMRLIHAVRELNREQADGADPFRTIALFTEPERHAMFVREADEAVCLGPATVTDGNGQRTIAYLDYERLERALVEARAEAAWVGWGFVAEHAAFADLCKRLEIEFIGPDANVMRWLGDKIAAKHLGERLGIPVTPWSGGPVDSLEQAREQAQRLGFPLLIKATAGGGGRGIRRLESTADLAEAFERARSEAFKAFGDATVFLERLVTPARHVEVQVIADHHGTTWAVGVRDCTIQRRNQKLLEEAPSPVLSAAQDAWLRAAAVRICQSAGYRNAGTVEFLFDPSTHGFAFMEVNTRLQVEHPVTELTTGLDLVKLQLHVARGGRLGDPAPDHEARDSESGAGELWRSAGTPTDLLPNGHAIEVRLNAEDPAREFAPAPGIVEVLKLPTGPGVRIDTGVGEGDLVPAEFDSMIAKLIAFGHDRQEALARLQRALADTAVVIRGGTTNKAFLLELLNRAEIRHAEGDNAWLDRLAASGGHLSSRHADVALLQAAIAVYDTEFAIEQAQFYTAAARGRPRTRPEIGYTAALRYRGCSYRLTVFRLGPDLYRIDTDGCRAAVRVEPIGKFENWLTYGGNRHRVLAVIQGPQSLIEVGGVPHQVTRDDGGTVRAPSPAVVLAIPVKVGDLVAGGARLVVLEAMKMEMPVTAPFAGRVRDILVTTNVQVDAGAALAVVEPVEQSEDAVATERVRFDATAGAAAEALDPAAGCRQNLEELRRLLLGFDVDAADAKRLLLERNSLCAQLPPDDADLTRAEDELLTIFAGLCGLTRRQPATDDPEGAEALRTEEYLFTYLRAPDTRGEGLPPAFMDKLRQALSPYGVSSLDPSPARDEGLLRIFKSQQRMDLHSGVIMSILQRRLEHAEALIGKVTNDFRSLLDRLITVTHGRAQAVSDTAREVRYRYFDQPLFERTRNALYAEMEGILASLTNQPNPFDRVLHTEALVECTQPLANLLLAHVAEADASTRELLLEVLTRRYYRMRRIDAVHRRNLGGQSCALAEYDHEGARIHVLATHATWDQLADATARIGTVLRSLPAEHEVVVDFYVWSPDRLSMTEENQVEIHRILNRVDMARRLRRVVVVVGGHGRGISSIQHFTYRPCPTGYEEEKVYRGLHPMMAKRLHLSRLSNFAIERLPSAEDVYLFHGVAHANPKDQRLFAIAEVRDLTPVRDRTGRIVQLPYLERMLMEALAGIREFQSHRAPQDRLLWNRILLYVWPPLDLRPDELNAIMRRLAPATEGLGIEQVTVRAGIPDPATGALADTLLRMSNPGGSGIVLTSGPPPEHPLEPLSEYDQKVLRMRQRGLAYPYEIIHMLTPSHVASGAAFPAGEFAEYDLTAEGTLARVDRPPGRNTANIVVGTIRNWTAAYPEGMTRVILLGDPSKAMGALAEPECWRICAALDLATQLRVPVEWFAVSAGAKISMESGTENMDWIALVLRRLIEFTQAGGEVNVVVNGINVGAQPYWNSEATMLLHTRGILIMTPLGAMVLTGKQALDYSGSVSAEDNQGIGGYERIMGPNGQAQYWARDLTTAAQILFQHYEHTYVVPGESFPRRVPTNDPRERDAGQSVHGSEDGDGFELVADIFSDDKNPGRKRPFAIRKVMSAVIDQDHAPLERWADMRDAEVAVVWDAHLGGYPICLLGIESQPRPRLGFLPADGPDHWTAGTLFPKSSKKIARSVNAASGNRPLVVLANLSGFDGSPESMRELQLEYGAEIGRAVVNFKGPMVFCVISRYHGGAYVVFSGKLNENLEVAALEGSYASVIGGAPAAAVVFAGAVTARTRKDPRVQALEQQVAVAQGAEKARLRAQLDALFAEVHAEKLGEVADEFDKIHSVHRALQMGSLDRIIPAAQLRPYLIDAVERGMQRYLEQADRPKRFPWPARPPLES